MNGRMAFVALSLATALGILGTASAVAEHENRSERGGSVRACSLDGVNPAFHPEVFGNAAAALSFGFVRGPDRVWRVQPNCRPH
jgi:hypothetical protein